MDGRVLTLVETRDDATTSSGNEMTHTTKKSFGKARLIVATAALSLLAFVIAMNFSTPEKKLESAPTHRHGVRDPQFQREMGVLLGPSIVDGNRIVDLQNGEEIFPSMLEAIGSARKTITFETYIYWSGDIGERFAEALSARAAAGVEVNVLIDWAGSVKMDDALIDRMKKAGVRVEWYRPLRWYTLSRINNRTHRKLLVVDGRIAFTGGVGIADGWAGNASGPRHWRDMHFRVEGPVALQFQAAFNDNWIKTTGTILHGDRYFPPQAHIGEVKAHLFVSSPAGGSGSMHAMYLLALSSAEESIDLAAAYFVPDELIIRALVAARARNVRIRILLPGAHTDSDVVRHASKASWGELLAAGVEIYEYRPTMMHSKMLIVDREMVSVGSTNFDIRSFRLNDEASLNIYDRPFAERMSLVFEQDLSAASPYGLKKWERRSWKEKFMETIVLPIRSQL